jgi:hypothetical protein
MSKKKSKAKKVEVETQETKLTTTTTTAKAKPTTRAEVFHQIVKSGAFTKKEITDKMKTTYGGSLAEATFQVDTFLRLLTTMGYASKKDDGTYALEK